ncbi:MAG: hypothetical protein BZ135_02925 [Methanosphaera sp. rholeuAM6]|nr:MAG: hypothetical protein BZ135_02925 [Methanosphaera sp. rholeuAM6]
MVMLVEILFLLLIIIIVLLFLLFLKSWHLHITLKNDDLVYDFIINIKFLIVKIIFELIKDSKVLKIQLSLFSKTINIIKIDLNKKRSKDDLDTEQVNEDVEKSNTFSKLIHLYPLLVDAKDELMHIIVLITKMITFTDSYAIINLGLSDNNLTIKFCTLLWSLTAPLYPLGFKLLLTPEINQLTFKSDINIKFDIKLFNLLKITYMILKTGKLRKIVNFIRE